jgi:hypothetical protein
MSTDSWSDEGDTTGAEPPFDDDSSTIDEPGFDDPTDDDTFDDPGQEPGSDDPTDDDTPALSDEEFDIADDTDVTAADTPDAGDGIDVTDAEVPGTDPDASDLADDDAFNPEFPPHIELETLPEPVDGAPWSDADLLGDTADTGSWNTMNYAPPSDDLYQLDASTGTGWEGLLTSDDPAVSSLARWWQ